MMPLRQRIAPILAAAALIVTSAGAALAMDVLPLDPMREIASGVLDGRSTVAWSPDGARLAYIKDTLVIEDVKTGERSATSWKGVYFLLWHESGDMLALRTRGARDTSADALWLDSLGAVKEEFHLEMKPDAAYPMGGFGRLLLVMDEREELRIGVRTRSVLYELNTSTGKSKEVFSFERIHPKSLNGEDFIMGWSGAGPSSLDEAMLLISYIDPPALNPYSKAEAVDYLSGRKNQLFRAPEGRLLPGASWSPRGDRIAVPGNDGILRLMDRDGETLVFEEPVEGSYASWSPSGRRLCFGNVLLYIDGTARRSMTGSGPETRCYWKPTGREVAALSGGVLRLYRDPLDHGLLPGEARAGSATAEKVRVLRNLLREGLIDTAEYNIRYRKLLGLKEFTLEPAP